MKTFIVLNVWNHNRNSLSRCVQCHWQFYNHFLNLVHTIKEHFYLQPNPVLTVMFKEVYLESKMEDLNLGFNPRYFQVQEKCRGNLIQHVIPSALCLQFPKTPTQQNDSHKQIQTHHRVCVFFPLPTQCNFAFFQST